MYSIAMDVGKYRTYGIVERDGKITKEGFRSFMDGIDHATVIVEASSTIDRIVSMLPDSQNYSRIYPFSPHFHSHPMSYIQLFLCVYPFLYTWDHHLLNGDPTITKV